MTSGTGSAIESDLLETIVAATRHTTEARARTTPIEDLERRGQPAPHGAGVS